MIRTGQIMAGARTGNMFEPENQHYLEQVTQQYLARFNRNVLASQETPAFMRRLTNTAIPVRLGEKKIVEPPGPVTQLLETLFSRTLGREFCARAGIITEQAQV